jgi:folylpolyglutamate synthase/dihydropteroate synthase
MTSSPATREDIAVTQMYIRHRANSALSQEPTPTEAELFLAKQAIERRAKKLQTIAELTAVKEAANRAIDAALTRRDFDLHYSWEGHALYNAMHDLTSCDELYETASEIATLAPQGDVQ